MRILHSSDWHVGRSLHGQDMSAAHELYFDHLLELVKDQKADAVLVSGDVFDRAVPSLESLDLVTDVLRRLTGLTRVVLTPGNHDSGRRLGFLHEYLDGSIYISPTATPAALTLPDARGNAGAVVYGLPYLDPDEWRFALSADKEKPLARRHQAVLSEAMARVHADRQKQDPKLATIVMAHAFVTGAEPSESERDISVGGVDNVGAAMFEGFDYVALGHLHRPQQIGHGPLFYSGSPVAFSFSEANDTKLTRIFDTESRTSETVNAPVLRPLARIKASIAEIEAGKYDEAANAWCEVTITDDVRPQQLHQRVNMHLPNTLALYHTPKRLAREQIIAPRNSVSPGQMVHDFLSQSGIGTPSTKVQEVIDDCLSQAKKEW